MWAWDDLRSCLKKRPKKTRALSAYNMFVKEQKILSFDKGRVTCRWNVHVQSAAIIQIIQLDTETDTDTDTDDFQFLV